MASAGGPLIVDPNTQKAYTYGPGTVPVYYDLGNFGTVVDYSTNPPTTVVFDNAFGKKLVETGFAAWSNIATSAFRGSVIGDFSQFGLPNIDSTNITDIIGGPEHEGVFVIFDEDGSIMENFFGVSPAVLGISSPQYSIAGTTTITMSWTVLNGQAIDPQDTTGQYIQGVATHEFGHSLGMAHTQTNGAAYFFQDNVGPDSCTNLPYNTGLTSADIETMYPYINPAVGGTGMAQANIHTLDTIGAFSDLYPGPGWPNAYATITGKILGLDGKQLTGVNVIARNIADPYVDTTSAISGQMTQGLLGPDGTFTLHGLKPGAQYVVYTDAIAAGGYPTPPMWFLPGPERFWSGPVASAAAIYNPCQYGTVKASAGKSTKADIQFTHKPGTPMLYLLGYGTGVGSLTGDGNTAVGNYGRGGPVFTWTAKTGVTIMPTVYTTGEKTTISPNGEYISTNLLDVNSDNSLGAYRWDSKHGWLAVAPIGSCGTDTTSNFAVANDGSVLGLAYNTCTDYHAFRWNPSSGSIILPSATTKLDGTPANSRVDEVSADGTVAVGWEEVWWGGWNAGLWTGVSGGGATPHTITDVNGDSVGEAFTVSGDGSTIGGMVYQGQYPFDGSGWRRKTNDTDLQYFPTLPDTSSANPYAMNSDGSVMVGFSGNPFLDFVYGPFIWTKELGTASLDNFVTLMGGSLGQLYSLNQPTTMSFDGTTIGGWSAGNLDYVGWVLQIKNAYVCHPSNGGNSKFTTLSVSFPVDFDKHLAAGDTPGPCKQ